MSSRSIIVAVLGVLVSLSLVQAVEARDYTPLQLQGICNDKGGVYFGPSANGVYACLLPDGTVIICGGTIEGCETNSPNEFRSPDGTREHRRREDHPPLDAVLALEELILGNLRQVALELEHLQSKVADVQTACAPSDLVPLSQPGSIPPNYCQIDDQGNLLVHVKNQGLTDAGASTLRVTFATAAGPVVTDVATPALASGGFADLSIAIPPACSEPFPTACKFTIDADIAGVVVESDESNNNVAGVCVPVT